MATTYRMNAASRLHNHRFASPRVPTVRVQWGWSCRRRRRQPGPANLPQFPPPDFSAFESTTCTAAGEANGCARWVGKPGTFLEAQDIPLGASYRAARLQCTPFYYDWKPEGPICVVGAEIVPSSQYSVEAYSAAGMGI